MAKALSMTMSIPGVEIWINYNAANRRIQTVEWTIPQSGVVARVRLFNVGALFYDRSLAGPASDTENVPGNWQMREVTEDGQTFLDLPAEITYQINIQTLG